MRKNTLGLIILLSALAACTPPSTPTPGAATAAATAAPADTPTPAPVVTVLPADAGAGTTLTLDVSSPGLAISPNLYGIFFEEDNHAGDGGLYAELIRNRGFNEDDGAVPAGWSLVTGSASTGGMALDFTQPLNALNRSLKLDVQQIGAGGRVGISNGGYWGIRLVHGTAYTASFYAKAGPGFAGPLTVSLENSSGAVLAQAEVSGISAEWQQYTRTLTVDNPAGATEDNRLVLSAAAPGTVWLQMVSLFPPTWKNRPNGLRGDLMQMLAGMNPKMCRFPGGTSTEGGTFQDHYRWKQTIGDLTQRPGHMGAFGYFVSDGLGFHELLQMCEDLGGAAVFDVFAGYSHNTDAVASQGAMQEYVDDALDAIEYANGDASTPWGAKRAANGHPAPFNLKYIEVGNEDWMTDAGSQSYRDYRYRMFYDQIKARYPEIQIISTMDVSPLRADIQDYHIADLIRGLTDTPRAAFPKIFVGEWYPIDWNNPPKPEDPPPGLDRAILEAVFMTRFEPYGDSLWSTSYAPLLVNDHDRHFNWGPVYFDAMKAFGTPSYYAQAMFARQVGDETVPASLAGGDGNLFYAASRAAGGNTIYLKVVNNADTAQLVAVRVNGAEAMDPDGRAVVLTSGSRTDRNTMDQPNAVTPAEFSLQGVGPAFTYSFPPHSVTALTLGLAGPGSQSPSATAGPSATTVSVSTSSATARPSATAGGIPSSAELKGYWTFDAGSGAAAADSSGNGNDGTLGSGAAWAAGKVGAQSLSLSGAADSFVQIPNAVVDTRKPYSVAAWVKLDGLDDFQTAVSVDGLHGSGFYLQWRKDTGKFAFTATMQDADNPDSAFASSRTAPAPGTWYHLAGVFDGRSLKLYVNGVLEGAQPFTAPWTANGPTAIGRAKYNGNFVDFFRGRIDEVRFYQGVLTDAEVAALAAGR